MEPGSHVQRQRLRSSFAGSSVRSSEDEVSAQPTSTATQGGARRESAPVGNPLAALGEGVRGALEQTSRIGNFLTSSLGIAPPPLSASAPAHPVAAEGSAPGSLPAARQSSDRSLRSGRSFGEISLPGRAPPSKPPSDPPRPPGPPPAPHLAAPAPPGRAAALAGGARGGRGAGAGVRCTGGSVATGRARAGGTRGELQHGGGWGSTSAGHSAWPCANARARARSSPV